MLVALNEQGKRINAWEAERGKIYYCPECKERVVLKRGQKVIAHFAHYRSGNCDNKGETHEHYLMKKSCYHFFEKYYDVELEKKLIPERRTDLALRNRIGPYKDRYIAVEVQYSPITIEELTKRTKAYNNNEKRIPVLWIFHVERLNFESFAQVPIDEVRIPHVIREFEHMTNFIYAMDDSGKICECKLIDAEPRISEWYAEGGEYRSSSRTPETLKYIHIKKIIENPKLLIRKYERPRKFRNKKWTEYFWLAKFED